MTTQVVVMNKMAVALENPVGSVADYAGSSITWLERHEGSFDSDSQRRFLKWTWQDHLPSVRTEGEKLSGERGTADGQREPTDGTAVVDEVVERRLEYLRQLDRNPRLAEIDLDTYLEEHAELLTRVIERVFETSPRPQACDRALRELAGLLVAAQEPFSTDASLVFVGFGTEELFPASQGAAPRHVHREGEVRHRCDGTGHHRRRLLHPPLHPDRGDPHLPSLLPPGLPGSSPPSTRSGLDERQRDRRRLGRCGDHHPPRRLHVVAPQVARRPSTAMTDLAAGV